jgi:hypothetical protein
MPIIKFKRFNKPQTLKLIGRDLLMRFFDKFKEDFDTRSLPLPPPELADGDYFRSLSHLLMCPEGLPDRLNEALFAIDEMASPRGQELLEAAVALAEPPLRFQADSSPEDIALQVWLAAPALLARTHNAQRLRRLTAFQYAGSNLPKEQRPASTRPDTRLTGALTAALDPWFANNHRGEQTTKIELYSIEGEEWFLVRHGDTFTRAPKVQQQKTEIIHFRPERDDVIVYSPERDEIRINARTKGERDLYLEQFGLHLGARGDYFCHRDMYTLEPLRREGIDSLDVRDVPGIKKVLLREIEAALENGNHEVIIRAAADIFHPTTNNSVHPEPVPERGTLTRAIFEFQFTDSAKPRLVELRPPNILKFGRRCDAQLVQQFLANRAFRIGRK